MAAILFPKAANFASEIVVHGCARPWFIYVKTFFPAFLKLVLTISILDLEDILRDHAKRKAYSRITSSGRGYGHSHKPKIIAKPTDQQRFAQKGLRTLLIITEPLEKIGFAWLLYNATEQFFSDWQLLLERSIYCSDTGLAGPLQRARVGGSNIGVLPEGAITPLPIIEQNRAPWVTTSISVSLPPGFYKGFFTVTVQGPLGGITNVRARMRVTGLITLFIESPPADIAQGEASTLLADGDFTLPFGGTVVWELAGPAVPVGLLCDGGHVIVFATSTS